jgi:hypothetical protein
MFKKMMLLAVAAMAVVAVAAPAAASANWKDAGVDVTGNPHVNFSGPASFNGALGSVSCQEATATVQLTGGTNDAHIKTFTVDNPGNCVVGGFLGALCGTRSLTTADLTQEGTATISGGTIELTNISLENQFGSCATILLTDEEEGSLTATPNNKKAISSVSLSGSLEDNTGGSEVVSGTLAVSPAGTYGIE